MKLPCINKNGLRLQVVTGKGEKSYILNRDFGSVDDLTSYLIKNKYITNREQYSYWYI